ncbi:MAG: histidine kinase [Bacteroidetes bacterium]|nr:histidine kinase [Bacteroidota bacterium]
MSIRVQLALGFFILILIFLIDFEVNQRLSNQVIKNTTYISNSETVIRNSNILHKDIIEMQSGFRGFLLTGQDVFLEPYYEGLRSVPVLVKDQSKLLSEGQRKKLMLIDSLHLEWIEYANLLISSKLDTFPEASTKYQKLFNTKFRAEVGKKLNDRIHNLFLEMDNSEYQIRQERRAALQETLRNTKTITLTLTMASIVLALLSSFYFVRLITKRISKMVKLAEAVSKGEFRTIEDDKHDELNKLAISLNRMSQTLKKNFTELTKKNSELDQFAYVVSHDLKAPLRGIANIISWIEEDHEKDTTPEIRKNLALIKGRTSRLENMINGLLEYARVGKVRKGLEKVNVSLLLQEVIDLLVPQNFNVIIEGDMPELVTERLHIQQVFSNLISNAVKYNDKAKPTIVIGAKEEQSHYRFSVADNGKGIEKQYFEKIFVIFQTLQERDAFESTGVGLAIVKKIIEDHKGSITVESVPGEGTEFRFTWPKNEL